MVLLLMGNFWNNLGYLGNIWSHWKVGHNEEMVSTLT